MWVGAVGGETAALAELAMDALGRWQGRLATLRLKRAAQNGDRAALQSFYRQLYPEVAAFVRRRVSTRSDAEDLTSHVFEAVLRHLEKFDSSRGSAHAWVFRIARNAVIDFHRARSSGAAMVGGFGEQSLEWLALCNHQAPASTSSPAPLDALIDRERNDLAQRLLADLAPEIRQLFELRYVDGLRHRDIADMLGLSPALVRKRLSRAMKVLREMAENPDALKEADCASRA